METALVAFEHPDDANQRCDEQNQEDDVELGVDLGENLHGFVHGLGEFSSHGREGLQHLLKLSILVHRGHAWLHDQ